MKIRCIMPVLAALMVFAGCNSNKMEYKQWLGEMTAPGLALGQQQLFDYEPDDWQLAYIESRNEFRMMKDDLSDYFILTCDRTPSEGAKLKASLVYTTTNNVKTETNLSFTVERVDQSGLVWMYNTKKGYLAVVRIIW